MSVAPPLAAGLAEAHAPAPAEPALLVRNLRRKLSGRDVLKDVSFEVGEGRALGIVGANGSGKTILMRLLATLDRPDGGTIRVDGVDTVVATRKVRRLVGYVPEAPMLYDGLTLRQYMEFVALSRGLGREVRSATIHDLLEVVSLGDRGARLVGTLSPGERRRLALAAALVHDPSLLLLDDPLRGLDGAVRLEQIEVLRELRNMGVTIVLASSLPDDLLELCDEVAVLRDGTVAWRGTREDARVLAGSDAERGLLVRLEAGDSLRAAADLVMGLPLVDAVDYDEGQQKVWFRFHGEAAELATVLRMLVEAGCAPSQLAVEQRTPGSALARLLSAGARE